MYIHIIWWTIHGYGSHMISVYGEINHWSSWWINVCLSGAIKKCWAVSPTYAHKLAHDTQTDSELPTVSPQGRMVSGWSGQSCTSNLDEWVDKPFRNYTVNIDIMDMRKTPVPDNVDAFRQGTTFGRLHHSAPKWTAYKGSTPACSPKVVQPGFAEIQPSNVPQAPQTWKWRTMRNIGQFNNPIGSMYGKYTSIRIILMVNNGQWYPSLSLYVYIYMNIIHGSYGNTKKSQARQLRNHMVSF